MRILQFWIVLIVGLLATPLITLAQDSSDYDVLYACIEPIQRLADEPTAEDAEPVTPAKPYLVAFGNAPLFGFKATLANDELANVTIYSHYQTRAAVGVFYVLHDFLSGGYRRDNIIEFGYTSADVTRPNEQPCAAELNQIIDLARETREDPDYNLIASPRFEVTNHNAILVNREGSLDNLLEAENPGTDDCPVVSPSTFFNTAAFYFFDEGLRRNSIQILRMNNVSLNIAFPFVTEPTALILVSNKQATLQDKRSVNFSVSPPDITNFIASTNENEMDDTYFATFGDVLFEGVNIFNVINEDGFQIFPGYLAQTTYRDGYFMKLLSSGIPCPAQRAGSFATDTKLMPITVPDRIYCSVEYDSIQAELEQNRNTVNVYRVDANGRPTGIETDRLDQFVAHRSLNLAGQDAFRILRLDNGDGEDLRGQVYVKRQELEGIPEAWKLVLAPDESEPSTHNERCDSVSS